MAENSSKSLSEKLGIKQGVKCLIINAPENYFRKLNLLPKQLYTSYSQNRVEMIQYFAHSREGLRDEFPKLLAHLDKNGALWISWPKKSSGVVGDLSENEVRAIGLSNRVVDVKVVAIDEAWSGLKFVYRLVDR